MPSIEPIRWAHRDTAPDALKLLLDLGGGRVESVIVQRRCFGTRIAADLGIGATDHGPRF
jgi:hypothetical protein